MFIELSILNHPSLKLEFIHMLVAMGDLNHDIYCETIPPLWFNRQAVNGEILELDSIW